MVCVRFKGTDSAIYISIPHSLPVLLVQYTYYTGREHIFHQKLDRLELARLSVDIHRTVPGWIFQTVSMTRRL